MNHNSPDFVYYYLWNFRVFWSTKYDIPAKPCSEVHQKSSTPLCYFLDQPCYFLWVAWLSRFQSLLKSIRPKILNKWVIWDRDLPLVLRRGAKIKTKKSELNAVRKFFFCISRLANAQINCLKEMLQKTLNRWKRRSISCHERASVELTSCSLDVTLNCVFHASQ